MKKIFLSLTLAVLTLLVFVGCTPKTHKVTFKLNNGQSDVIKEVKHGEKVEKPNNPEKEDFVFQFWTENGKEFDFNTKIEKDHILTATWIEQTTGLKVVLPEGVKVTTPNVDLTNLNKGTKLDFEITIPNYHVVKSLLANTSDITNKLQEGKKFSFTVNKNVTIKVTFDVTQEVKTEFSNQLAKVTDIVVKKSETDPKLTLEEVKSKISKNLDLDLVDLKVAQKDEKFVVTLTSKKVNTLKTEKEITVTYEKIDSHKITVKENLTVLTQNVELTAVKHGTEIEIQVNIPAGKVIDTLTANTTNIKNTLTTENKFKFTVNEDVTFEVTFKFDETILNQEVEAELNKIDNQTFELLDEQTAHDFDQLKQLLTSKVNTELVTLELVKNANDYTVKLVSKKLETITKTKNITVTYNHFYTVTLPKEIKVQGEHNLNKVPANTQLTFNIELTENQVVEALLANEENILPQLNVNTFNYTVNKKVEFKVTIGVNPTIIQEVENELSKINDETFKLVNEQKEHSLTELKTHLESKVQTSLVSLEVVKNETNYTVTLTSKKVTTLTRQKNINITYNHFYTVTIPSQITLEETQGLEEVAAGTVLKFVVNVPSNQVVSTLLANEEDIIEALTIDNKFEYTVNQKVDFKVTFAEKTKLVVTLPNGKITQEGTIDLTDVPFNTELTFLVNVPKNYEIETLTANSKSIIDLLDKSTNKFKYNVKRSTTFAVTFKINEDIKVAVEDELSIIQDEIQVSKPDEVEELEINKLTEAVIKVTGISQEVVTLTLTKKTTTNYTLRLTSKEEPTFYLEKEITISYVAQGKIVTIDLNGGTYQGKKGTIQIEVQEGKALGDIELIRKGYKLSGLYKGSQLYDTTLEVTENISLKVEWEALFITFTKNNKTFVQGVIDENTKILNIPGIIDDKEVEILGKAFIDNRNIQKVVIEEGVKRIGLMAFFGATSLTEIQLPNTLEYIGNRAFSRTKVKLITIPQGVKEIDFEAFADTQLTDVNFTNTNFFGFDKTVFKETPFYKKSLVNQRFYIVNRSLVEVIKLESEAFLPSEITLPVGVKALGERVFYNNERLTKVLNADQLIYIGDEALRGTVKLNTFDLSQSIRYIGHNAFNGATALTSINLVEGLEFVGRNAFSKTSLTTITIPNTLKNISEYAFADIPTLTTVNTNNQIEKIGEHAFKNTAWLNTEKEKGLVIVNNILINAEKYSESNLIPSNVVRVAGGAFDNVPATVVTIPNTVQFLDKYAIKNMKNMHTLNFSGTTKLDNYSITYDRFEGLTININSVSEIPTTWPEKWITYHASAKKLVINWAIDLTITFDLNGATSPQIPEQVILKGNSINMPEKPTREGFVFVGWLTKAGTILTEGESLYESQKLVAQWTEDNSIFEYEISNNQVTIIGLKDKSKTEVEIPNQISNYPVTKIGPNAFQGNKTLTKVTFPETIVEIGANAFENTSLTEIKLSKLVTRLNDNLFLNSTNLSKIQLNKNINSIGENVFKGTAWLTTQRQNHNNLVVVNNILVDAKLATGTVTVPETVKVINTKAFNQTQATSIIILEGITTIKTNALTQSSTVTEITIPRSVEFIEANAFNVETLTIKIPSRYVAGENYQTNWDNSISGKHNVNYKSEDRFKVTISGKHNVLTSGIDLNLVPGGTTLKIELITDLGYVVHKVIIDGVDHTDKLNKNTNVLTIFVESNLNISFDQIKDPVVMAEIEQQKDKLTTPIYISKGIVESRYSEMEVVSDQVNRLLDSSKITYTITKSNEIDGVKYYKVHMASKTYPAFTENVEFPVIELEDLSREVTTQATQVYDKWSGGSFKNNQTAAEIVKFSSNGNPIFANTSIWVSPENVKIDRRFVVLKINQTIDLRLVWLRFPSTPQHGVITQPEFKIYVATTGNTFPKRSDWKEVAHVQAEEGENTSVSFGQGTLADYVKLEIVKGRPTSVIDDFDKFAINHFGTFGFKQTVNVNINLNGGNVNGDKSNQVLTIEKGGKIHKLTMPNIVRENHLIERFEKDGEPFDVFNTPIENSITLKVIWVEDPSLRGLVQQEIQKVKDKFVVHATELTEELVKQKVMTFVDNSLVDVEVTLLEGNKYTLTIKHKQAQTIFETKVVTAVLGQVGEKVKVTFDLNGGNISGDTNNIVVEVLKGEKVFDQVPENPVKVNHTFKGWLNSLNELVNFENLDIFEEQIFTAKFEIDGELAEEANKELAKIAEEIGLDGTIDINTVKAHIETIVDSVRFTVLVEEITGVNKNYRVTVTLKDNQIVKNSKDIYVNKFVELTYPDNVLIDGKASPQKFVLGTTKELTLVLKQSRELKTLVVNSVDVTNEFIDNKYNYVVTEQLNVTVTDQVKQEFIDNLQSEVNQLPDTLKLSAVANEDIVLAEVKKVLTKDTEYSVSVAKVNDNKYKVTLTSIVEPTVLVHKEITVLMSASLNKYISKTMYNGFYSDQDKTHRGTHAFDLIGDEPNLETFWYAKQGQTHFIIMDFGRDVKKLVTGFKLTNAENSQLRTKSFKIYGSNDPKRKVFDELYSNDNNTEKIVSGSFDTTTKYRFIKLEILKGEQNGYEARIHDITLFGEE